MILVCVCVYIFFFRVFSNIGYYKILNSLKEQHKFYFPVWKIVLFIQETCENKLPIWSDEKGEAYQEWWHALLQLLISPIFASNPESKMK